LAHTLVNINGKNKASFQLAQIVKSSRLDGVEPSAEAKNLARQVLEGTLSPETAKQTLLKRHIKIGV